MIRLIEGRSISDVVEKSDWNYYSYQNRFRGSHDLKIVMTASSGDAAVYVTLDGSEPSETNFAFSSGSLGGGQDVINLIADDPAYAPCLISDCTIILGVYGYMSAEYNILLASSLTSIQLNYGVPQLGSLRYSQYDHYQFSTVGMSSTDGARVTINQYSGTLKAYFACNMQFPNASKHDISLNLLDSHQLDITLDSFSGCSSSSLIGISVFGVTSATYRFFFTYMQYTRCALLDILL